MPDFWCHWCQPPELEAASAAEIALDVLAMLLESLFSSPSLVTMILLSIIAFWVTSLGHPTLSSCLVVTLMTESVLSSLISFLVFGLPVPSLPQTPPHST